MLMTDTAQLAGLLACPACRAPLPVAQDGAPLMCSASDCPRGGVPFDQVAGQQVLIEFGDSVLDRETMLASGGSSVRKRDRWRTWWVRITEGINPVARHFAKTVISELEARPNPKLLVIGGGAIGSRAEPLYESAKVDVVGFDIYASPNISFLADAHRIPLADASVDAVWIQAVLELTVDPLQVVSEIRRVLRPGGLVFATTAYMWPVCEGAYDYSRWTPSGLRWVFRHFEALGLGSASGLGTGVFLSLRALAQSLLRSTKAGQIATVPFFWLRFLDRFTGTRKAMDAAPALFFYGRLADRPIEVPELIRFYEDQIGLERAGRAVREA